MAKPVSSELAVWAWLQSIPGITPAMVSTRLPQDQTTWATTGFVRVGPEFGGALHREIPVRSPVMELHVYGTNPGTNQPGWQTASDLAELIIQACYANHNLNNALDMPVPGYRQARVCGVWPDTDPRRNHNDVADYGHFELDVEFRWIEIPE
jgi:hypothetical protein